MLGRKILLSIVFGTFCASAFADVPVIDYSQEVNSASTDVVKQPAAEQPATTAKLDAAPTIKEEVAAAPRPNTTGMTAEQRINKLEQQVANLNQQVPASKIEDLQRRLEQATGKIEVLEHQVIQLKQEQKNYYKDLDQRIGNKSSSDTSDAANKPNGIGKDPLSKSAALEEKETSTTNKANKITNTPKVHAAKQSLLSTDTAALKEQQAYQTAIDLLPDKKDESAEKLRAYLDAYPNGAYAGNAHYWLGEISFLQNDFDVATSELKTVVEKYPTSKKVPDAMLKLALIHSKQGDNEQAKVGLKQLIKRFPSSSAAQRAKEQLKALH
ncbi:MAG: tol-pal system protein YbgF [Gammaproteobacteria bacterium]|nr:tol-pal system protein YbgF [Gammaproteobacteria bacterium]